MKNHLKKLKSKLQDKYFCYFKDNNVLAISEDKASLPFIIVIEDETHPDLFLLSISVDYPIAHNAVEVALWANSIRPTAIAEAFYISQDGKTYLGLEALRQYEISLLYPIDKIETVSDSIN